MKRALFLILALAVICVTLTSCEGLKLVNNILGIVDPSNDTTNNNIDLDINFSVPDPERCTTHAIVPLNAIAPTCSTPGVSAGQCCQKCGAIIVAQVELPALEHTYSDNQDDTCNNCGYIREILCMHLNTKTIHGKDATCTNTGRTDGEQCVGCGKIIAGYEIIQTTPHEYDDDSDTKCNACQYVRKLECSHSYTEKLSAVAPTCTSTGLTEGRICVHCGEILVAQQAIDAASHTESEWIIDKAPTESENGEKHTECEICYTVLKTAYINKLPTLDENASDGLTFALNEDKNSYCLIDIGTCIDLNIVIPGVYNGKLVTRIADGAFLNNSEIFSVVIPEGVLNIGEGAFKNCTQLSKVTIPSTVTSIGAHAFENCALTFITLPEGLTSIEPYTFYSSGLREVTIPYGVTSIGEYAFSESMLYALVLPSSLEQIGDHAFSNLDYGLNTITIPNSVHSIGSYAFLGSGVEVVNMFRSVSYIGACAFDSDCSINYKGTLNEWNKIIIDPRNYFYTVVCTDGQYN